MTTTYDQIQAGWSAHGRDGEKIGEIEEVGQNYLLVTKGLIFPKDLYIPLDSVQSVETDEGRVILNVDKSQVDDMGWDEPPAATASSAGWAAGGTSYGDASDTTTDTTAYGSTDDTTTSRSGFTQTDGDTLRVPVHEEQLRAERTAEQAGEVTVGRNVVEEERTLDVPVSREEVEVRRVSTDRPATGDEAAFTDGDTIRVPVTAERVQVTKEPHVVEELEISKRQVTENQRVSDTVRREEVDVADTSGTTGTGTNASGASTYQTGTTGTTASGTTAGFGDDRSYDDRDRTRDEGDRRGEVGAEAIGGGAGALGGAAVGGAVAGPPGAVVGGVVGAAGGALAGESAEGGDEQGGSAAGGGAGALGGAVVGGAVAGPPGAVVGGAVGAGAGSGVGDQATEDDDDVNRR